MPINRLADRFASELKDGKADHRVMRSSTHYLNLDIHFDLGQEELLAEEDPLALMAHLDLLLCGGAMSDESRATVEQIVAEATTDATIRARATTLAVLTAPDCAIAH